MYRCQWLRYIYTVMPKDQGEKKKKRKRSKERNIFSRLGACGPNTNKANRDDGGRRVRIHDPDDFLNCLYHETHTTHCRDLPLQQAIR